MGVEQQQRLASRTAGLHTVNPPLISQTVKQEAAGASPAGLHAHGDYQTAGTLPGQQAVDHLDLHLLPDVQSAHEVMRSTSASASALDAGAHGLPGQGLPKAQSVPGTSTEDAERFSSYLDGIPDGELPVDDQSDYPSGTQQSTQVADAWQAQAFPSQLQQQQQQQSISELGGHASAGSQPNQMLNHSHAANTSMVRASFAVPFNDRQADVLQCLTLAQCAARCGANNDLAACEHSQPAARHLASSSPGTSAW